jgi:hypothetical protein
MSYKIVLPRIVLPTVVFAALLAACGPSPVITDPAVCTLSKDVSISIVLSPATCGTYTISNDIKISSAMTILPGTTVKFTGEGGLLITETGSLNATGTADKPITLTGVTATTGSWLGLAFRSNDPANKLIHVNISFAGSKAFCCDYFEAASQKASVLLGGATLASPVQVTIQNTMVSRSGGYGVYLFKTGSLPGFSSNSFKANTQASVSLPLSRIDQLDTASVYSGAGEPNTEQFVRVLQADNDTNLAQSIKKLDVAYRMSAGVSGQDMVYKGALTINAGAILEFESDSGLSIDNTGSLTVNGLSTEPVVFKGRTATKGYWKGINITSLGNTINFATIRDAGSSTFCCAQNAAAKAGISIGDTLGGAAAVTVSNSTLSNNVVGVFTHSGSTFTNTTNTFTGNTTNTN